MPDKTKGLTRFWREVKRRKVLRSLAIYLGSAFIILEASSIIFPLRDLPDWSIKLVLWVLIVGAAINLIISWHFDITSDSLKLSTSLKKDMPRIIPTCPILAQVRAMSSCTIVHDFWLY